MTVALGCCAGCGLLKPTPAGEVIERIEPKSGLDYWLYRPTVYKPDRRWPLLVVCCNRPWERPQDTLADWAALAEDKGLLLAAPTLSAANYTADQEDLILDEQVIKGTIKHVMGSERIAEDRVSITGMSNGARPAAFAGLRNPGTFRNVALIKPHFDLEVLEMAASRIDPYQKVLVLVGMGDLRKGASRDSLDWLYDRVDVSEVDSAQNPSKYPEIVSRNIELMQRRDPWIHIGVYEVGPTNRLRFEVKSSFNDVYRYAWDFGDGTTAAVARPEHTYAHPGEYLVTLKIEPKRGTVYTRQVAVAVSR